MRRVIDPPFEGWGDEDGKLESKKSCKWRWRNRCSLPGFASVANDKICEGCGRKNADPKAVERELAREAERRTRHIVAAMDRLERLGDPSIWQKPAREVIPARFEYGDGSVAPRPLEGEALGQYVVSAKVVACHGLKEELCRYICEMYNYSIEQVRYKIGNLRKVAGTAVGRGRRSKCEAVYRIPRPREDLVRWDKLAQEVFEDKPEKALLFEMVRPREMKLWEYVVKGRNQSSFLAYVSVLLAEKYNVTRETAHGWINDLFLWYDAEVADGQL